MLSKTYGAGVLGTDGFLVCCEAAVENGFPQTNFIGFLTGAARETGERVRTAIQNSGIYLEPKHVTINFSPADIRKEGCAYDVPAAVSLLSSYGLIPEDLLSGSLFAGELSLGGEILPVRGVISMVSAARDAGLKRCFLPLQNLREGSVISGIDCYGAETLPDLIRMLRGEEPLPSPAVYTESPEDLEYAVDFADISGQELVKRATLIAVSGRHNMLLIGPAGTGKSMVAERIPTIMPSMTQAERLELSRVYSISGLLPPDEPLLRLRPFRSPHHTISPQALTGGGVQPKPGEISLATNGVLFLDELPEFRTEALEVLRQPLEERVVHISRVRGSFTFPADFQLVCAMNPCRCGFWPDRSRCTCSELQVKSYIGRVSKPLLDRIDLCAETLPVGFDDLRTKGSGTESRVFKETVERVRAVQTERFRGTDVRFNSGMGIALIEEHCRLSPEDERFLRAFYEQSSISARGLHKILKVARTAADIEGSAGIRREHLAEAIAFRSLESKYWGTRPAARGAGSGSRQAGIAGGGFGLAGIDGGKGVKIRAGRTSHESENR